MKHLHLPPKEGGWFWERHPVSAVLIGLGAVLILALGCFLLFDRPEEPPEETASFCFRLSVYEDRLAVYSAGDLKPSEVLDISLAALPEADRQLLIDGIPLRNEEELRRAIEDYT